jgi:hypothetical protein
MQDSALEMAKAAVRSAKGIDKGTRSWNEEDAAWGALSPGWD